MFDGLSRRRFFAAAFAALPLPRLLSPFATGVVPAATLQDKRAQAALDMRMKAALAQSKRMAHPMESNGEEDSLPLRMACFAKGLPQNRYGEVEPVAYNALLTAISSGKYEDFERLPRGGGRKLNNPQSAYAFHLEGGDPHTFGVSPAPAMSSSAMEADVAELYWQALCRDTPFKDYADTPIIATAAKQLGTKPALVFRGPNGGNAGGPYVSQFLLKPIPFGAGRIEQKYNVPVSGSDFLTTFSEWSQIQAGFLPWRAAEYDPIPRYIRNGRDLAEYAHYDFAYQAYLSAALILINSNAKSMLNCNQFKSGANPYRYSTVEEGFVTFGPAEAADWLGRVTTAALKAAYCQKWMVHRRVRPEAFGGVIHQNRMGSRTYPVPESILHGQAVDAVFKKTNAYLLPQAYPEGCPLHPSYPSGHAAVAGACSVILKACFDGSMLLPDCVEPTRDGQSLVARADYSPTVSDEIDKLAFNVAMGRDWAGIHYRSDTMAGLRLGEDVGISVLRDMVLTFNERFKGFSLTRFDGSQVLIDPQGSVV